MSSTCIVYLVFLSHVASLICFLVTVLPANPVLSCISYTPVFIVSLTRLSLSIVTPDLTWNGIWGRVRDVALVGRLGRATGRASCTAGPGPWLGGQACRGFGALAASSDWVVG